MHLSTGKFEYTVQEENLLSRLNTGEEKGQNLHQLRICQALGSIITAPYYLPIFICIPSFHCWLSCGIFQCWLLPTLSDAEKDN